MAAGGAADQLADHHPPHQPHALQAHSLGGDGVPAQVAEAQPAPAHRRADDPAPARILLVLLAAFLVARFVYGAGTAPGTTHVVIVDDSLSMFDRDLEGRPGGRWATTRPSSRSRKPSKCAAQGAWHGAGFARLPPSPNWTSSPLFEGRLSDQSADEIDAKFAAHNASRPCCTSNRSTACGKGRAFLSRTERRGQQGAPLRQRFPRQRVGQRQPRRTSFPRRSGASWKTGINFNLVDVAAPLPGDPGQVANHLANLALADLTADIRVALEDGEIELTATTMNYGIARRADSSRCTWTVRRTSRATRLPNPRAAPTLGDKFTLHFQRKGKRGSEITEKDPVEEHKRKHRARGSTPRRVPVLLPREEAGGLQRRQPPRYGDRGSQERCRRSWWTATSPRSGARPPTATTWRHTTRAAASTRSRSTGWPT